MKILDRSERKLFFSEIKMRLDRYERLMRLDKPIGILLLLWPTLWALWIAGDGKPPLRILWIFILGTVLMRSAGCVINDIADRHFDSHVERTRLRPLATGEVRVIEALILFGVLMISAGLFLLPLNPSVWFWALAAVVITCIYPFTKRFFVMPQAVLGFAFSFGIPMAFVAIWDGPLVSVWWLLAANFFWVIAYDTEYAMVDKEDDMKLGLKTSAITFGRFEVIAVLLCYEISLCLLAWVGYMQEFDLFYFFFLFVAQGIVGYHYWLIRTRDRARCFQAFLHNNWFGATIFIGLVSQYNLKPLLGYAPPIY